MSLANGARLGPYEILGPLGAGGLGEVYRAVPVSWSPIRKESTRKAWRSSFWIRRLLPGKQQ